MVVLSSFSAFELRCLLDCFWIWIGSAGSEDCVELWDGRCFTEFQGFRSSNQEYVTYQWSEACEDKGKISHCQFQAEGGTNWRHHGYTYRKGEVLLVGLILVLFIFCLESFMCSLDLFNIAIGGSHFDMHPFAMLLFYGPRMDGFN